ncbi:MAG: hypothetical protein HZB40_20115 [Rhodocyclales bacterium]|nr:hypothetical protein [Rhodocyclales bacterium]
MRTECDADPNSCFRPLQMFVLVVLAEALLSQFDVSQIAALSTAIDRWGKVVPVLAIAAGKVNGAEVSTYIAATFFTFPLKVYLGFRWLSGVNVSERSLVFISPKALDVSVSRRILHTVILGCLCIGITTYALFGLGDVGQLFATARMKVDMVYAGGILTWLGWDVFHLTVVSLLWAATVLFLVEWSEVLFQNNA